MKKAIPNYLTIARGLLTLVIIALFFVEVPFRFPLIFACFFLASISDWFDGYLARKWQVVSDFGIVFDSLFDKILTISVMFLLVPYDVLPDALLLALVVRDLFVDGLKNFSLSRGKPIAAIMSGKWKFVFQILMLHAALALLIFPEIEELRKATLTLGLLALAFSLYSGGVYSWRFLHQAK